MAKLLINVTIAVKADADDDDAIKEAVHDKLNELMEADELEYEVVSDDDDDVDDFV